MEVGTIGTFEVRLAMKIRRKAWKERQVIEAMKLEKLGRERSLP